MLTRLKFKNWRSLRDVEINNLTPLTIFIGANSSGKSNILDALYFLRYAVDKGIREAVFAWRGREKIRTYGVKDGVMVDFYLLLNGNEERKGVSLFDAAGYSELNTLNSYVENKSPNDLLNQLITQRWQLLRENFSPPVALAPDTDPGDFFLIDAMARNLPTILNFMHELHPAVYNEFETDVRKLLGHVATVETERNDRETRFLINEKPLQGNEAPSISAGTARIIAILTAYYALDMRSPELPGLVVIEEPDTAIHPLLLGKLVDLLRSYTEQDEPRQFILTTHNPQFLNYFEPEEVRVVERDEETVETWVESVPDHLRHT